MAGCACYECENEDRCDHAYFSRDCYIDQIRTAKRIVDGGFLTLYEKLKLADEDAIYGALYVVVNNMGEIIHDSKIELPEWAREDGKDIHG